MVERLEARCRELAIDRLLFERVEHIARQILIDSVLLRKAPFVKPRQIKSFRKSNAN